MDDLEECFLDPASGQLILPEHSAFGLANVEPTECIDQHIQGEAECDLFSSGQGSPAPCCVFPGDEDGCCQSMSIDESEAVNLYAAWLDFFDEHCSLATVTFDSTCSGSAFSIETGFECLELSASSYGGNIAISLDPSSSWMTVNGAATGYVSTSLSGYGAVSNTPVGFLKAYAVGDSPIKTRAGKLVNVELVLLSDALVWTGGGNYLIPAAQMDGLAVQGVLNGVPKAWDVGGVGTFATGEMRPDLGYWNLNYSSTNAGYTVVVHLEGPASPL